jgi:hypothetical protein
VVISIRFHGEPHFHGQGVELGRSWPTLLRENCMLAGLAVAAAVTFSPALNAASLDLVWVKGLKPLGYPSEGTVRQGSASLSHKDFCFLPLLQIAHNYVLCEDIFG